MTIRYGLEDTDQVAKQILETFPSQRYFALYAPMGSGKTTLINAMCRVLGVVENTSSPTFSIINEYRTLQGDKIYHSDWYRLKGVEDAIEAGVEDMLNEPGVYVFVEWPEIAESLLPAGSSKIIMELSGHEARILTIS